MATSSVMQSTLVSPVKGVSKGLGFSRMSSCVYMPSQLRSTSSMVVHCMTKDSQKENAESVITPKPKVSTNLLDVLAFSGPAPERINGRLAMTGFVAAIAVELFKGEDVFAQIADGGASWFLLTTVVLSVASLIPLSSGVTVESKSQEIMSSDAEMWNGRFAMLGLVALAFTEFVKGGALIA